MSSCPTRRRFITLKQRQLAINVARLAMREGDNGWVSVRCDDRAEDAEPISVRYTDILAASDSIANRDAEALRLLAE